MKLNKYSREVFGGNGGVNRFLSALDGDIQELHRRVDSALRSRSTVKTVQIKTAGTKVTHNLGRVPTHVSITPLADARVWEVKGTRTTTSVVLKSSADAEVHVEVRG